MRAPVVVFFTTYPIAQPRSGGQLRARALVDQYRAAGFEVVSIAVSEAGAFPRQEQGPTDLEFPLDDPRTFEGGERLPHSNDLQAGRFLAADDRLFKRLCRSLPKRVDVFHLEQPFLLPAAKRLLAEGRHAALVYGSQNVEAPLREAVCRQAGSDPTKVVAAVDALEREAARLAELTLAVSEADGAELRRMGARNVVIAPNGIHAWKSTTADVARWRARLGGRRVALFVGSAHPPNAAGFVKAVGDTLGFVPPDCCIVAAGRVGQRLTEHYAATRYAPLALARLHVTGEVSDADLAALKDLASISLLPIFEGGGSNIKTSEALLSGRPIIATSTSLRGFERFLPSPEVTIADTQAAFVAALREAFLRAEEPAARVGARHELLWERTLAPVPAAVKTLLAR